MEMTIPAKSTGDLLQDLKYSAQIADYLQGNKDALLQDSFTDELNRLYKTQGRNKSEIAREAGISDIYLYQIFSGRRVPQRNRLISICLSMHLSVEETQRLLYLCGHAQLYARDPRDAVLLHCLMHRATVFDTNALLFENGLGALLD